MHHGPLIIVLYLFRRASSFAAAQTGYRSGTFQIVASLTLTSVNAQRASQPLSTTATRSRHWRCISGRQRLSIRCHAVRLILSSQGQNIYAGAAASEGFSSCFLVSRCYWTQDHAERPLCFEENVMTGRPWPFKRLHAHCCYGCLQPRWSGTLTNNYPDGSAREPDGLEPFLEFGEFR